MMIMIIVMLKKPCSTIPCSSLVGFSLNLGFYTLVNLAPGHHHDSEGDDHDNGGDDDTVDDMCGHNATKMLS